MYLFIQQIYDHYENSDQFTERNLKCYERNFILVFLNYINLYFSRKYISIIVSQIIN